MINRIIDKIKYKCELGSARKAIKKYGFWFFDIPRTSSSSIKVELGQYFGRTFGKFNLIEESFRQKSFFADHMLAVEMRELLGKPTFDRIFKFTITRNPWDRMLSIYRYRQKVGQIPQNLTFKTYVIQFDSPRYVSTESASPFDHRNYYYSSLEFISDYNGNILIDYIGKYENREADLKKIAETIGMESLGKYCLQTAQKKSAHYSEFYDAETEKIVGRVFAEEIERFGYVFEKR
jgi:Sulfotransferase family